MPPINSFSVVPMTTMPKPKPAPRSRRGIDWRLLDILVERQILRSRLVEITAAGLVFFAIGFFSAARF